MIKKMISSLHKIAQTEKSYTPFTQLDCDLDRDPEDVPVYVGHSLLFIAIHLTS